MSGQDFFDFGFSSVDLEELEVLQEKEKALSAASGTASATKDRLDRLYNAIQPLLNNLKADTSKDYIYWPDRMKKIESFETHLQKIYLGE